MTPLVLLPGLLSDATVFAGVCDRFPGAVAIDGFGAEDSLAGMARRVLDLDLPTMTLLGHSMGARVALEVYRSAPERVERLALVSTGVHAVGEDEPAKRHALLDLGRAEGIDALADRWLPPMVAPSRMDDAELMASLRAMVARQGVDVFAAQITALLARPEVESMLPAIRCPVLVAAGSEDRWSPPAQHEAIAAAVPGAVLRIVPGAGHMLPVEAPDEFNDLVAEWLARSP